MIRAIAFFLLLCGITASAQTAPENQKLMHEVQSQSASQPTQAEIIELENRLLQRNLRGKCTEFDEYMGPDFHNVGSRIQDRAEVMANCVNNYAKCPGAISETAQERVSILSPDVATIVYRANLVRNCPSERVKGTLDGMTVWVRLDGVWKAQMHSESIEQGFGVQSN